MSGASSNRIQRSASLVEPFGALGDVVKGFQIWTSRAPSVLKNPSLCFIKCEVLKGSTKTVLKCRELHTNNNDTFSINMKDAYNCNIDVNGAEFKDIGLIPHKNVPCVMDFLKQRYQKGIIYTYANPLLITLNPFTNLNNATSQIAQQYRDAPDVSALPPHIFATARTAVDCLYSLRKSQTIIVSGESGAGKTEASKQIMHYLASCKVNAANSVQDAVLAANPVLEAFGNAKTIRNNNSSRFGRFVRLCINPNYGIENGHIENFLLEKTRIVKQDSDERNYHIFYQFLKGATPEQRERYSLLPMEQYTFLNPSCHDVTAIDDVEDWAITMSSFKSMDFSDADMNSVLSILAGVLLLGNINIDGGDVSAISKSSRDAFKLFCKLLLLNEQQCEEGLCVKISSAGSDVIRGYWNEKEAEVLKQSFAKALYERLFRWIVSRLNTTMASKTLMKEFIGMLDIFGFEVFANNSIEQLFINITNEMLQNIFINIVFKKEQEIYRDEGISTRSLVWTSNDSLISMLIGKSFSLTSCLEDQCLAPGGTDENFLSFAYRTIKNPAFLRGKASPSTTFIVAHTIGEIQYSVKGFVNKNKDILRSELVQIAQNSEDPVVCIMFENVIVQKGKLAKGQLNGSQMINQLNHLIACIKATETHFVRCVKPNEDKLPLTFDSSKVLVQLTALSIIEALDLRSLGFSYRRPFSEFSTQFRFLDLGIYNHETDSRIATEKLLEKACIPSSDYQIGRTMVFIKDPGVKLLMKKQRVAVATWYPVISLLEAMVLKKKYGETVELGIPGLKRFQANIRRRYNNEIKRDTVLLHILDHRRNRWDGRRRSGSSPCKNFYIPSRVLMQVGPMDTKVVSVDDDEVEMRNHCGTAPHHLVLTTPAMRKVAALNEIYMTRKIPLIVYFRRAVGVLQSLNTKCIKIYALGICINLAIWLVQDLLKQHNHFVEVACTEIRTVPVIDRIRSLSYVTKKSTNQSANELVDEQCETEGFRSRERLVSGICITVKKRPDFL